MDRRIQDPIWDHGLGFGPVRRPAQLGQPWEEGPYGFLTQASHDLGQLQANLLRLPVPVPKPPEEKPAEYRQLVVQVPRPAASLQMAMRTQDLQAQRQAALSKWAQLLRTMPHLFPAGSLAQLHHEDTQVELGNLELVFAKKATNTLLCRVSALAKFARWVLKCFPGEIIGECLVFLYVKFLEKQRPDSSGPDQLLQALNFLQGTIGLAVHVQSLRSARVEGLAHVCMRRQKPPKQAPALTVEEVKFLHAVAEEPGDGYEKLIATSLLLMLYGRARHSDLTRAVEVMLDVQHDWKYGYVECKVSNPKQTKASKRRNMMLPLVAPVIGVVDMSWAALWMKLREHWSLAIGGSLKYHPLQPAVLADGSLAPCNMRSGDASKWLRAILAKQQQPDRDRLLQLSSHSLKATTLSWCSKIGIDEADRALLGYHMVKGSSVHSYSRDSLAGPLRKLESVLTDIRRSRFDPDATRSGRWIHESSSSESDSEDLESHSSGSDASDDTGVQVAQACSHTLAAIVQSGQHVFLRNPTSSTIHVRDVSKDRLLCGRTVFSGLVVDKTIDFSHHHLCLTCQNVAEGILNRRWASTQGAQ